MEFTIKTAGLRDALRFCTAMHPGANNILLSASKKDNTIQVESADNGSYIKYDIAADVKSDGVVCVHTQYLNGLKLNETAEFEIKGNSISIKSGRLRGTIQASQDKAQIELKRPTEKIKARAEIPGILFKKMISCTRLTSSGIMANEVNGVKILIKDGRLIAYTSERYRACIFDAECPTKHEIDVVMPPSLLQTLVSKVPHQVCLGANDSTLKFQTEDITCYVPTLQADVDDVKEKIENIKSQTKKGKGGFNPLAKIEVDCDVLIKTINAATSINVGALTPEVRMLCEISSNKIRIIVSQKHGSAGASMDIDSGPSEIVKIMLVPKYVTDMLSSFAKQKIKLTIYKAFIFVQTIDKEAAFIMATAES